MQTKPLLRPQCGTNKQSTQFLEKRGGAFEFGARNRLSSVDGGPLQMPFGVNNMKFEGRYSSLSVCKCNFDRAHQIATYFALTFLPLWNHKNTCLFLSWCGGGGGGSVVDEGAGRSQRKPPPATVGAARRPCRGARRSRGDTPPKNAPKIIILA